MKGKGLIPLITLLLVCAAVLFTVSCETGQDDGDPGPGDDDAEDDRTGDPQWYRSVVFMEIFPRSYSDSDGDGIGDLAGLTAKLPYLEDLGVGGIWLTPIYPTPFVDSGYDVADYRAVNPDYGTMEDFTAFLQRAHELGIRVFLDGVFNHTSSEHPWFVESRSSRDNPKRDWYVWADRPLYNCFDPFSSASEGVQWTLDPDTGQMYYHHFHHRMPDLNYFNPEMREAVKDVVRFWLDLGVDGFRLDVAHMYYEDESQCYHHPLTHQFLRELREVTDGYHGRALVGEVAGIPGQLIEYLGNGRDELHMIFNFDLVYAMYASLYLGAPVFTDLLMESTHGRFPPGGQGTVLLSNHDFLRDYSLLLGMDSWCKLASALQLTLPGTPFLYYGQEIGMADGTEILVDYRDVARTPMHWDGTANAGFTTGEPWIAMAPNFAENNVEAEAADPASLLNHYKRLIRLRNETEALNLGEYRTVSTGKVSVFAFFRATWDDAVLVALNFSLLPRTFTLDLRETPWYGRAGRVRDLYSGQAHADLDAHSISNYQVSLPGHGFALLALDSEGEIIP